MRITLHITQYFTFLVRASRAFGFTVLFRFGSWRNPEARFLVFRSRGEHAGWSRRAS